MPDFHAYSLHVLAVLNSAGVQAADVRDFDATVAAAFRNGLPAAWALDFCTV